MLRKYLCCKTGTLAKIDYFSKLGPPCIYILEKQTAAQASALWRDVLPKDTIKKTTRSNYEYEWEKADTLPAEITQLTI